MTLQYYETGSHIQEIEKAQVLRRKQSWRGCHSLR